MFLWPWYWQEPWPECNGVPCHRQPREHPRQQLPPALRPRKPILGLAVQRHGRGVGAVVTRTGPEDSQVIWACYGFWTVFLWNAWKENLGSFQRSTSELLVHWLYTLTPIHSKVNISMFLLRKGGNSYRFLLGRILLFLFSHLTDSLHAQRLTSFYGA